MQPHGQRYRSRQLDRVFQTYRDGDIDGLVDDLMEDEEIEHQPYASVTVFSTDSTQLLLYDELDIAEVRTHGEAAEPATSYDLEEYGFEHTRTAWYDSDGSALMEWCRDRSQTSGSP